MAHARSPDTNLRPEDELLICCARTHLTADVAERVRALVGRELDWEYLIGAARGHGVLPLLHFHLDAICREAIPRESRQQLRELFRRNEDRNLVLTAELDRVLDRLTAEDISARVFKGPALALDVFGDLALRQFADLDILIRREDVLRARDVLIASGYEPQYQLDGARLRAFLRTQCDWMFTRSERRIVVELAWGVVPHEFGIALPTARVWERDPANGRDTATLPTLPPEEHLLVVCVHAAKHMWNRLMWMTDVAEMLRAYPPLDWDGVQRLARELHIQRMLFLGLRLAADLLDAPVPGPLRARIDGDPKVADLAAQVRRRCFPRPAAAIPRKQLRRFHMAVRERPVDRIRYLLRRALTPTIDDWAALPLPDRLFFLYYAIRPLRLLGAGLVRQLKRRNSRPEPQ